MRIYYNIYYYFMKIFIKDNLEIVIDQIAYITTTIEPTSYTLVMVDGKSYNLTADEYADIKNYLLQ